MDAGNEYINLAEAYGNRIIEGMDIKDIEDAMSSIQGDSNPVFQYVPEEKCIIHVPSGRRIVFSCVSRYFEPHKEYYRLDEYSDCDLVRRAMNVSARRYQCGQCMIECIRSKLKIKKHRLAISRDLFNK